MHMVWRPREGVIAAAHVLHKIPLIGFSEM